jgi:hypothetical protein
MLARMERSPTQGVLSEAWTLYREHWQHLASIALIVYVITGFLSVVLGGLLSAVGLALAAIVNVVAVFWLQGAMVKAIEDVRDGQVDLTIPDTFRAVRPHLGRIAASSILAAIAIFVGFLFLLVPGFLLMALWVAIVPAIVLEDRSALEAFSRSQALVRGWLVNVVGLIVLTFLILVAAGVVIGLIVSPLPGAVAQFVSDLISGAVTGPLVALTWTLVYYRLREAKESTSPPTWPEGGGPGGG